MILETEEVEVEKRREGEQLEAREEALVSDGENIKRIAVTRSQTVGDSRTGSKRSKPQKRTHEDDDGEWNEMIRREL